MLQNHGVLRCLRKQKTTPKSGGSGGSSGGSMGPGFILEPEKRLGGKMLQNHGVLQCLRSRPTISCSVWSLDIEFDGKFTAT